MDVRSACSLCSLLLAALVAGGCARAPRAVPSRAAPALAATAIRFADVTQQAGITFRHQSGRSGRLYLPESMGAGCAFLDYDGDGRLDLFLVNSSRLPGFTGQGPYYPALYRNRGNGRFEDVTKKAGLALDCYGMGVAVGDYDNDGHDDLYLTAMGRNHLYHNQGDGTFADVTARAGVGDPHWSASAAWLDYDRDGRLDLFVCNYCDWSPRANVTTTDQTGHRHLVGPKYYKGVSSTLYHNRGDGTFEDMTKKAGIYSALGKSLGVVVFDADNDGWPDLVVANDLEPNLLYRNNHAPGPGPRVPAKRVIAPSAPPAFREIGVEAGVAYSSASKARAGMGIDTADLHNDGREAVVVGNYAREGLALFQSDDQGLFTDLADTAGLFTPSLPFVTFGALFADLDNDGRKELFVVNGHDDENAALKGDGLTYAQRPLLFYDEGGGRFTDITAQAGAALQTPRVARGLAAGDFDRDGDLDFLVSVNNGPPLLLRNDTPHTNHWLAVRARGVKSNRDGIGTRVTVEAGGSRQTGWIRSGSSYCSASDHVAWFGLGPAPRAQRITLRWPNGEEQTLTDVVADREIVVDEGRGIQEPPLLPRPVATRADDHPRSPQGQESGDSRRGGG